MSDQNKTTPKMKPSEESQSTRVNSQANGFIRSNTESEIQSSGISTPNESTAETAPEGSQRYVIEPQVNAIRQINPQRGTEDVFGWYSGGDRQYIPGNRGRGKKVAWKQFRPVLPVQSSANQFSLSIIDEEEEYSPTELPRYGGRKYNGYRQNGERFGRNGSKPYLRQGKTFPNNEGTHSYDTKNEGYIPKKYYSKTADDYQPKSLDSARSSTLPPQVEEQAQKSNEKGFIPKPSDFPTITSRYFSPRKHRKSSYAQTEEDIDITKSQKTTTDSLSSQESSTSDLTQSVMSNTPDMASSQGTNNTSLVSSQESSTSDLTASLRSSTSDLSSVQSFDSRDNSTGARRKIIINVHPEHRNYNFRNIEEDTNEDSESISSVRTVLPIEDTSFRSDRTLRAVSREEQIFEEEAGSICTGPLVYGASEAYSSVPDEEQSAEQSVNSYYAEPFRNGARSTSEVFSSASSARYAFDEEMSSSQSCYGNKISHFTLSMHNQIRSLKNLLAMQAFKPLPECNVDLPEEIRRTRCRRAKIRVDAESLSRKTNTTGCIKRSQKKFEPEQAFVQSLPADPLNNLTVALPRPHNAVSTIERLEDILEMLLTVGYKITKEITDGFGNQQVPTAIHNAMCDVKIFLEPIKNHIETQVQDEYMRPLLESIQESVAPIFHHLNDSIIAMESPATPFNYLPLQLVRSASWEEQSQAVSDEPEIVPLNAVEEIYAIGTYDRSIIDQAMHTFDHSIRFRAPFHRADSSRPHVVPLGLIEFPFHQDLLVIVTLDLGLIVVNKAERIIATISADGYWAGIRFAFGECLQTGRTIDSSFYSKYGELAKRAQITEKGITFQDENSPCTYLITNASTSTCQALTSSLSHDFLGKILYSGSRYGPQYIQDCVELLNSSKGIYDDDGTITWIIRNLKIKQTTDGQLILHKDAAQYTIIMTPTRAEDHNGWVHTTRLSTPNVHITSSMNSRQKTYKHHMYIRQDAMKIFSSDQKFVVRNGTQSAGIDKNHAIYLNAS